MSAFALQNAVASSHASQVRHLPDRVIVLGASGFIGARLLRHLSALNGLSVVGHSSSTCNLLDPEAVERVLAVATSSTSIVFCSSITRTVDESIQAFFSNVRMVETVINALPETGIRSLIFLSSVDVYGRPPVSLPVTEQTKLHPEGYYAPSKLVSEIFLANRVAPRFPLTILRLAGIYGIGDGFKSVIGKFLKLIHDDSPVTITGDGRALRDYVEVCDLCTVIEQAVVSPWSGLLNVATGNSITVREVAEVAGRALGRIPRLEFEADAATGGDLVFDTDLFKSVCPTVQLKTVEQGIADYVADTGWQAPLRLLR
jgi:UDP-glucose 4-epimerase